jgi:hypothetical protein
MKLHDKCIAVLRAGKALVAEIEQAEADKPKPRKWRMWDVVRFNGTVFIRTHTHDAWANIETGGEVRLDVELHQQSHTYLGNLADKLAQGEVLVATNSTAAEALIGWLPKLCAKQYLLGSEIPDGLLHITKQLVAALAEMKGESE